MKKLTLLAGAVMALVAGCQTTVDVAYTGWYTIYGSECGSLKAGCNYYWDGTKIKDVEDPFYYGGYTWDVYYDYYYGQQVWQSPSGIIYDAWGRALNSASAPNVRDMLASMAADEQKTIEKAGQAFAAKYSLSAETGVRAAKTLNDWAKLGFNRVNDARTDKDLADFTKRMYGVDFNRVSAALSKASVGLKSDLDSVINEAAQNWNTSPEAMREVLKDFHGRQLDSAGISIE